MSGSLSTYTIGQLINQTLKIIGVIGVGQTPAAEDANDALQQLNQMLALWQRQRWLVNGLITTGMVSTGAVTYTVGQTGNYAIPRPDRIESAFMRFLNASGNVTVDKPIVLINSREDYNEISVKNLSTVPQGVFYDNNLPLGTLYFWPIPPANLYEMFITTMSALQNFTSLSTIITLAPEYIDAMQWSLAERLRPLYQLPPDPTITALAAGARSVLRSANAQVPSLDMPGNIPGQSNGWYNPFSDRAN
ncbi:MAG TPA: hypothetical protein PLI96_07990 [Halothiobacillus sp.]|nr:MAG: hypothetical protein B7X10_00020 [Burkholderiales bacterium 21-58-4]HUN00408.1 hypothetical protein [Halothiobacillus sp.]